MGCVVNGPGEAREADYGVAGGRGVGILFKKGQVVKKVNDEDLLGELIKLIDEDYGNTGEKNENS
jgi:(E)-4-hydroxy-3-methylbut-2-enyl-diphosphate synthase